MEWPQITLIVLFCIRLFIHADRHGERVNAKYDFFGSLIYVVVNSIILYFGGFWT